MPSQFGNITIYGTTNESLANKITIYNRKTKEVIIGFGLEGEEQAGSNWEQPYEGQDIEGNNSNLAAAFQGGGVDETTALLGITTNTSGKTLITKKSTQQIYQGEQPIGISFSMEFRDQDDCYENELALLKLLQFKAPTLVNSLIDFASEREFGEAPISVEINLYNKKIYNLCIIESVSASFEGVRDAEGNRRKLTAQIQAQTKFALNRNELPNTLV